ncbi:MAG: hypothetical protein L0H93_17040 [Nocardioides sp.]|nr:hypothetical protein [Nocardioides sp.]
MNTPLRRFLAATTATSVAMVGALALSAPATQAAPAAANAKKPTNYAFYGTAYGTRAGSNTLGVKSGSTAWAFLGCTRMPGVQKTARVAAVNLPTDNPVLHVGAVTSKNRTYRGKRRTGIISSNRVAKVVLGSPKGVNITIKGLETSANAFARRNGSFGVVPKFSSADIEAHTGIKPLDRLLNRTGATINTLLRYLGRNGAIKLPGLGRIALGATSTKRLPRQKAAVANATALRVQLQPAGNEVVNVEVGRSRSRIAKDVPSGVFRGLAEVIKGKALAGIVNVGAIGQKPLSCEGTRGKVRQSSIAGVNLLGADVIGAGVARTKVFGRQGKRGYARAWTESSLANIKLGVGNQALTVRGIVARANITQTKRGKLKRNIRGSRVASISFGGKKYRVPKPGVPLKIDGLLEISVMKRSTPPRAIKVTALQIKLLDGTGAVLNIGNARARINRR